MTLKWRYDQNNLIQYVRHVEFTSGLHFDTFSRLGRQNASAYQISCKSVNISQSYDVSYISYIVTFQLLQCFPASKVTITRHSHIQASEFSLMAALLKFWYWSMNCVCNVPDYLYFPTVYITGEFYRCQHSWSSTTTTCWLLALNWCLLYLTRSSLLTWISSYLHCRWVLSCLMPLVNIYVINVWRIFWNNLGCFGYFMVFKVLVLAYFMAVLVFLGYMGYF